MSFSPATKPVFREHDKQREFVDAAFSGHYRLLAYGGGIRSGKTYLMLGLVFALCRIFPNSRWAFVRKDLPRLRQNTLPTFNKLRPSSFVEDVNQGTWTATCTNGSQIIFFSESLDTDPDLDRWKGLEVNGFVLEEANELDEKSYFKAIERAGSWIIPGDDVPQPQPFVFLTFNPAPGWIKRTFYDPWRAGSLQAPLYFQPARITDNPYIPTEYVESLKSLPPAEYKRFVEGDWDSMAGMALPELAPHHIVPAFDPPSHWRKFMAFDWGYAHPFSVGLYCTSEDGRVHKMDTITGHRMGDAAILDYVRGAIKARGYAFKDFAYTVAGGDCWRSSGARTGVAGPSTAETFTLDGWPLQQADDKAGSRIPSLSNMRRYLAGGKEDCQFVMMDTPGNRACFEQLQGVMLDPDKPEDALKTNANEKGQGGDDSYDETRYALMSRPLAAKSIVQQIFENDRSPGMDWTTGKPAKRPSPEDELERMLSRDAKVQQWQSNRTPRWK